MLKRTRSNVWWLSGLALLLCAGAVFLICREPVPSSETGNHKIEAWFSGANVFVQPDSDAVLSVRLADLLSSKAFQDFAQHIERVESRSDIPVPKFMKLIPMLTGECFEQTLGLKLSQVEKYVSSGNYASKSISLVLITRSPMRPKDIVPRLEKLLKQPFDKEGSHNGVDLLAPELASAHGRVFAFVEPTLAVFGTANVVRDGISTLKAGKSVGLPASLLERLARVRVSPGTVAIGVMRPTPNMLRAGQGEHVEVYLLRLEASDVFTFTITAPMKSEAAAVELHKVVDAKLSELMDQFDDSRTRHRFLGTLPASSQWEDVRTWSMGETVTVSALFSPKVLLAFVLWCIQEYDPEAKPQYWICMMHPEFKSPDAGWCDVCGLKFAPVFKKGESPE